MKRVRLAFAVIGLGFALTAQAQVRCKMPNGVWIDRQLGSYCPAGASQAQTLAGRPLPLTLPPKADQPALGQESPTTKMPQAAPADAGVSSTRSAMPFEQCVSQMLGTLAELGGANTRVVVSSPELRVLRICAEDGSVLMTCSRPDGSMVTTKSPFRCK